MVRRMLGPLVLRLAPVSLAGTWAALPRMQRLLVGTRTLWMWTGRSWRHGAVFDSSVGPATARAFARALDGGRFLKYDNPVAVGGWQGWLETAAGRCAGFVDSGGRAIPMDWVH